MEHLQEPEVKYKKYFYALRPLLACKYIEKYQCPPPVFFEELLSCSPSLEIQKEIEVLLEKKKCTKEIEFNPQIPIILDFISSELEKQKQIANSIPDDHNKDWELLNRLFLKIIYHNF